MEILKRGTTCLLLGSGIGFAFYKQSVVHGETKIGQFFSDIAAKRVRYYDDSQAFLESDLVAQEPIQQFKDWFTKASETPGIEEANAMALATATRDGKPSVRIVLLKEYNSEGFKFFTNYDSRKGKELDQNPYASLMFYWEPLKRSVRIEGKVQKLEPSESDAYFYSRPIGSRAGACISPQSQPIRNRDVLRNSNKELLEKATKIGESIITRPPHWGGFILLPESIEFWQGQTNRLHDRIRFRRPQPGEQIDERVIHRGKKGWIYERLAP